MENLPYGSMQADQFFRDLQSSANGSNQSDALEILKQTGANQIRSHQQTTFYYLFLHQFKSPITRDLIFGLVEHIFAFPLRRLSSFPFNVRRA
jgi:hypothetical protein